MKRSRGGPRRRPGDPRVAARAHDRCPSFRARHLRPLPACRSRLADLAGRQPDRRHPGRRRRLGQDLQVLTWIAADHRGPTLVVCPVALWTPGPGKLSSSPRSARAGFHGGFGRRLQGNSGRRHRRHHLWAARPRRISGADLVAPCRAGRSAGDQNPDTRAARAARSLTDRGATTGRHGHTGGEPPGRPFWSHAGIRTAWFASPSQAFTTKLAGGELMICHGCAVVGPFLLRRVKTDQGFCPIFPTGRSSARTAP